MTNPTLERAARAADEYIEQCAAGEMNDQEFTTGLARAVLMAVREPELNEGGGDIYRAGFEAMFDAKFKDEYPMMSTGWEAMIDAILNDGEGTSAGQKSDGGSDAESDGH